MEYKDAAETEQTALQVEDGAGTETDQKDEALFPPSPLSPAPDHPFKKWMDSFRGRRRVPPTIPERYVEGWPDSSRTDLITPNLMPENISPQDQHWERSSTHSSHLRVVKTTTMSIASHSVARSRGTTQSTTTQSAVSDVRVSGDSSRPASSNHVDEAAEMRASKRRQVLRELVATEADYVLGLKALIQVLSIFNARPQIYHNIEQIHEIHEQFLTQLQTITPLSASPAPEGASDVLSRGLSKRLSTIDIPGLKGFPNRSLRAKKLKESIRQRFKSLVADPSEALDVAREIDRLSVSFSAYEEFCGNYDLLTQDVAILRRSVPNWAVVDQGIEALSKSVASMDSRKLEENKSMSMNDLMIKPIQRLCRYPLLLQDLLRHTPVSDCPSSHDEMRQILEALRILVAKINSATGNPVNKDRIQKTVILSGKIEFSGSHALQDIYKELGPLILCGALHVTYRTPEHPTGEFMACALFNCYLLLARGVHDFHRLEAVACIFMDDLRMDTLQNGRGLYCYGCPFSWKLLFQEQEDNYELILSASSATEEKHWKTELLKCSAAMGETAKSGNSSDPRKYSFMNLNLLPLDRAQYAVASLARRTSMDSLAISRKFNSQYIVIKKTYSPHNSEEATSQLDGEIERSKMPIARGSLTVTARRVDRVRLERYMADVYTRDVLPLPGMVLGRGDLFRRGSIMRRLSLHTGFNKRSSSVSTTHSGPVVPETRPASEYNSEEKEFLAGHDGCDDQHGPHDVDCESPKTPTSTISRTRTLLFREPPKKTTGSSSSPRSEKRGSEDSSRELSPSRKKWSSPKTLFSALSPKNLKRTRPGMGPGTES
ncbi:uncharacterized protein N7459_000101 [Penicillium hispanicum]|uniref:uncharacterized protein n=1 Tax=Penicillium hispanicum TaxID=1080232 RepID=UPI00253FFADF|nr:uncharacterized protein N7459_000101 [Penicillium hispanicum]KAJ5593893.1 hypothetical protein N7459_000101 [Penicillium hispanicum]